MSEELIRREEIYLPTTGEVLNDEWETSPERERNRKNARYFKGDLRLPVIRASKACPPMGDLYEMESEMVWLPIKYITKISRVHFGYYEDGGVSQDGSKIFYRHRAWLVDLVPESIVDLCEGYKEVQDFLFGCIGEMTYEEERREAWD